MMKKRILSIVLGLMLCIGVVPSLTACGGKKADISILLMGNNIETEFYEKHFKEVAAEMGISIKVNVTASANYSKKLQSEINGGSTPDIFYVRPSDIRARVDKNIIADISEYLGEYQNTIAKIHAKAMDSYTYDKATKTFGTGGIYAIPKDLSVQQLGYNKKIVEEAAQEIETAGLKLPWNMDWETENYTWDQFKQMAEIVAKKTGKYGCDIPDIEILTWSFGGTILSEDKKTVQINTDAFKKAAIYQAELVDCGAADYDGATYQNFTKGEVAFYGLVNSFDIKNFDKVFADIGASWDVMPWPVQEGAAPTSWQGKITSAGYAVSRKCKNKQRAVDVIMTLMSNQTQKQLVEEKLQLPLFTGMVDAFLEGEYSPISRQVYIDVITGKNGRFSDDYSCYELDWQSQYTGYLQRIAAKDVSLATVRAKDFSSEQTKAQQAFDEYNK